MDIDDSCTTLWKYTMPPKCTLTNGQMVNFMVCMYKFYMPQ